MQEPRLSPDDQGKVDAFISSGINAVERKPFRVWKLLVLVFVATTTLSALSVYIESLYIP